MGSFTQAEPLLVRRLQIEESRKGGHLDSLIVALTRLSDLYLMMGSPDRAAPLAKRAAAIEQSAPPPRPFAILKLAAFYQRTGAFGEAEPLLRSAYQRALSARDRNSEDLVLPALIGLYR